MSDTPTPEEIARVRAHDKRTREANFQKAASERQARADERVRKLSDSLAGERITAIEVEGMNSDGEISARDGHVKLTLASGLFLTVSVGGWSDPWLDVEVGYVSNPVPNGDQR